MTELHGVIVAMWNDKEALWLPSCRTPYKLSFLLVIPSYPSFEPTTQPEELPMVSSVEQTNAIQTPLTASMGGLRLARSKTISGIGDTAHS